MAPTSPEFRGDAVTQRAKGAAVVDGANKGPYSFDNVPSLQTIKDALPADCFRAELPLAFYYVARNLAMCAGLMGLLSFLRTTSLYESSLLARVAIILAYIFFQGTLFWGIFVLGHDAGHGSFSPNASLNWTVGNFLHTLILVPYESWRVTHRHHHKNTGHIDKDEIFFPMREKDFNQKVKNAPVFLGFAWLAYLIKGHAPRGVRHFNPWAPLFRQYRVEASVAASVACYFGMLVLIASCISRFGFVTVAIYYLLPVVVFGSWLVVVTFLHHQEKETPWYGEGEWDYVRGNLSSIDRNYWPFHNLTHSIGTHQIHHLFPVIPHYKLDRATAAFRKAFPELVRYSDEAIIPSFIKALRTYMNQAPLPESDMKWTFH